MYDSKKHAYVNIITQRVRSDSLTPTYLSVRVQEREFASVGTVGHSFFSVTLFCLCAIAITLIFLISEMNYSDSVDSLA